MPERSPDRRPVYQQVADDLRRSIATGTYVEGDKLPSRTALAKRHGIALGTVDEALAVLRQDGLIVTSHGRGSYVQRLPEGKDPIGQELQAIRDELEQMNNRITALERRAERGSR